MFKTSERHEPFQTPDLNNNNNSGSSNNNINDDDDDNNTQPMPVVY
jgi:hypothetical protein